MNLRHASLPITLLLILAAAPSRAADDRASRAEALHRLALERIAHNTFDERRAAAGNLEEATLLAPGNPAYALTLARLYLSMGHLRMARQRFEQVAALAPGDANARLGLGLVWRRDWLKFLDRTSLRRAGDHLSEAVRLDPGLVEAWLVLTPLLVEQGDLRAASAAAERARDAAPGTYQPLLAMAYTSFRSGEVERADTLFARVMPRLPPAVRERFDDIAPVATAADTAVLHRLADGEKPRFVERFWKRNDPDLATPENEARLEYWSRVAHAFFLFYDPRRREWDQRGEVYVRYGPPAELDYNPLDMRLSWQFSVGPSYPANILVWNYPELGMRVVLQDRLLNEFYLLPIERERDPDPLPDLARVDSLGDRVTSGGGRAVFPALPPGVRARPVESVVAGFRGDGSGRTIGAIATPGAAGDSLVASFVVLDTLGREVVRQRRAVGSSECEPNVQVGNFAADLPPGDYRIGLTVRDRSGRRGLARHDLTLEPPGAHLALSDVVLTCAVPEPGESAGLPALVPNVGGRVGASDPVTAYFEISNLATGANGDARFQVEYAVRWAEPDRRNWFQRVLGPRQGPAPVVVTRDESNPGHVRRQFLSVPLETLPAGRYRLEIRVADLLSGEEARGSAEFARAGRAP